MLIEAARLCRAGSPFRSDTRITSRRSLLMSTNATWLRNLPLLLSIGARGKINPHPVVEQQGLRRLREMTAFVRQLVLQGRIEYLSQFSEGHVRHPLLQLSFEEGEPESMPPDLIAEIRKIAAPVELKDVRIAHHLRIPSLLARRRCRPAHRRGSIRQGRWLHA